jgi:hypothetical protein
MVSCSARGLSCSRVCIRSAASLRPHSSHLPTVASVLHFHSAAALSKYVQSSATSALAAISGESGFLAPNATFQELGLEEDIRYALAGSGITQPSATQVQHPLSFFLSITVNGCMSERQPGSSLHDYPLMACPTGMPEQGLASRESMCLGLERTRCVGVIFSLLLTLCTQDLAAACYARGRRSKEPMT